METVALMSFERPFERSIIKSDGRQHLILFQQIYQTKYFGRLLDLLNKQVFIISSEHISRSAIRAAKISKCAAKLFERPAHIDALVRGHKIMK